MVDGSGCLNTKGGGCGPTPAGCKLGELNVFLDRPNEKFFLLWRPVLPLFSGVSL